MIHLEFFGAHIGVRADQDRSQHIEALWSSFARPLAELPGGATTLDVTGPNFPRALSAFAIAVNAIALDACPDLAMHAGALDVGGATLALPGTSGAGKSTLTAACVQAGMGYISDEALCLPYGSGSVSAYPRPIALSPWSMRALGFDVTSTPETSEPTEFIVAPSVLGETCVAPGPLRHVVVPLRAAGGEAELAPRHRADAVALMLKLSFNHFRRPADAFELVTQIIRNADVWDLRYSDPLVAAQLLIDRFA